MSWRCQRRMVSGVTMVATCLRIRRPSRIQGALKNLGGHYGTVLRDFGRPTRATVMAVELLQSVFVGHRVARSTIGNGARPGLQLISDAPLDPRRLQRVQDDARSRFNAWL